MRTKFFDVIYTAISNPYLANYVLYNLKGFSTAFSCGVINCSSLSSFFWEILST